jgi:hypothetical protein
LSFIFSASAGHHDRIEWGVPEATAGRYPAHRAEHVRRSAKRPRRLEAGGYTPSTPYKEILLEHFLFYLDNLVEGVGQEVLLELHLLGE